MKTAISYGTSPDESDFLSFNIKNKELFKFLNDLGIKIKNTKEGEFSNGMKIELPSGEIAIINGSEIWCLPYIETNYISSWLVSTFLWEVEDSFPHKQEDEYSNFTLELINILNKANIITLKDIKDFYRFILIDDLEKSLGHMDGNNIEGYIESASVSESGNILLYTEFKNNKRLIVNYDSDDDIGKEECNDLNFVIAGKLKIFNNTDELIKIIEKKNGNISENVSTNTDYIICNDIKNDSLQIKSAKELGIAVLSESAFIRKFDITEKLDSIRSKEKIDGETYDLTINGGVLDFIVNNGLGSIIMEVWKDEKWLQNITEQRNKLKVSKKLNIDDLEIINNLKEVKKENNSEIEYEAGEHIFHDFFGEGIILNVDNFIVTIAFKQGIKRIAKGHPSIKKIS